MLVVDASVAVKWFFPEPGHSAARALEHVDTNLVAPEIVLAEVANVVWRKHRLGECTSDQAAEIVGSLPQFFDLLEPLAPLSSRALSLAFELDHPVYDCLYLACAETMLSPLLTDDQRLLRTVEDKSYPGTVCRLGDPLPPSVGRR